MKILITGSSGMLGQALCVKLIDKHKVIGIDVRQRTENRVSLGRLGTPRRETPSECEGQLTAFYQVDLADKDLTIQKIKEISPDVVLHCAAYTDVDRCELNPEKAHKLNFNGTANVAEGCKLTSSFMIYISTDFVFDGKKKSPYAEKDKPNPISVYGRTKLEGENAVKQMLDKYLIIRTSWLFGKGGENFVEAILEQARCKKNVVARFIGQKKELKVVNDQFGSPTYTVDLADAITGIINNYQLSTINYQLLNITNSGSCSWYEFAKEIVSCAGIRGVNIIPISSQELDRPAERPKMCILDNSRFSNICGKALPHWREALKRYLKVIHNSSGALRLRY